MSQEHLSFRTRYAVYVGAMIFLITSLAIAPATTEAAGSPNPHWRKDSCDACHQAAQPTTGEHALNTPDAQALCGECHKKRGAAVCRHRSDLTPESDWVADFDDALQAGLEEGKVVCTTCHDVTPHCALDIKQRYRNASFLRSGPFDKRGDQCFGCHSKSGYRQKSPHMHVSKGQIKEGHCVFCHGSVPQRDESGQWQSVQFAMRARHLRSIRRHISRYATADAPCWRTHSRRHIVELFISMTLKCIDNMR